MDANDLLIALADGGFDIEVVGGKLRISPSERLTDDLRGAIREHREALLAARCETCGLPTGGYGFCTRHDPFREEAPEPCA